MGDNYWRKTVSRRTALRGAGLGAVGLAGAALVGCDDDEPASTATAAPTGTAGGTATATATSTEEQPQYGGVFRQQLGNTPHLDVTKENTLSTGMVSGIIFNSLLRFDPKKLRGERAMIGDLAESWEVGGDGTEITFNLREGVTFHDGTPLTSADVVATLERGKEVHPFRNLLNVITALETPDDHTVTFKTSAAVNYIMEMMAATTSAIVPKHVIETDHLSLELNPIGTGPYSLEQWNQGVSVNLKKNPNYFLEGLPYFDEQVLIQTTDVVAVANALRTGELDASLGSSTISTEQMEQIRSEVPGVNIGKVLSPSVFTLFMNNTKAPFDDPRIRKAVSLVVDQVQLNDLFHGGRGAVAGYTTAYGLSPEERTELIPGYDGIKPEHIAEAKQLMDAVGRGEFDVDYHRASAANYEPAQVILTPALKQLGINLIPRMREYPSETVPDQRALGYELSGPLQWVFALVHPSNCLQVYTSSDADNRTGYANPQYDEIYSRMVTLFDDDELSAASKELETILTTDVPTVIAPTWAYYQIVRPEIQGFYGSWYLRDNFDNLYAWRKA